MWNLNLYIKEVTIDFYVLLEHKDMKEFTNI